PAFRGGARPAPAAPANNNFNNAIALSGIAVTTTGSNVGANKQRAPFPPPGEPNHAGNPGGASVWWTWTAPVSGPTIIDTAGSSFNTLLAVYTGTVAFPSPLTLTNLASNDDYNGNT